MLIEMEASCVGSTKNRSLDAKPLVALLFLGFGMAVVPVSAEESSVIELSPFETVGQPSRSWERIEANPLVTQSFEEAQIARRDPGTLSDVLRLAPAIHIDRTGLGGSVSSVYLRGGDPNFTLVLYNGVELNDPTNSRGGGFDFSSVDPSSLAGFSIVKGASSGIFGSEALNGAINLNTFASPGEREGGRVRLEVGEEGYFRANGQWRERDQGGSRYFGADYLDAGDVVRESSLRARRYSAGAEIEVGEGSFLRVFGYAANIGKTAFPDDSGGPEFAVIRERDDRDIEDALAGVNWVSEPSDRFTYQASLSLYDREESLDSPGVAPGLRDPFGIPENTSLNELRRYQLSLYGEWTLSEEISLLAGGEAEQERSEGNSTFDFGFFELDEDYEMRRDSESGFVELVAQPSDALLLQIGGRLDQVDGLDDEFSLLASGEWRLPGIRSVAQVNYGEGFKKPSVFALTNPVVGNPDLRPEFSESVEANWRTLLTPEQADWQATLDVSVFQMDFEDLVDFDPGPPPQLVNRSQVDIEGAEAGLGVYLGDAFEARGFVAYVETSVPGSERELLHRPEWRGGLSLFWAASDEVDLTVDFVYVGRRLDSSIPTGERRLGRYLNTDVTLSWQATDSLELVLAASNLLDENYREAIGFPAPSRWVRLGVESRF